MKIIEKRPIPMAVVKETLHEREKALEGVNLMYEQRKLLDYTAKFSKLNAKDAVELQEKLNGLKLNLTPEQVVKICDILPETVDDVRAVFRKEKFKYDEDKIKGIIDCVMQYK